MDSVLFVEDDRKISDLTARYIREIPMDVLCAYDGGSAVAYLEERRFALIILDIMLPDANGFIVLENLRTGMYSISPFSTAADTPVILLTALSQTNDIVRGLRQGADDYIIKPYDPQELTERIKTVLKRAGVSASKEIEVGNIRIDLHAKTLRCNGHPFDLQRREKDLLLFFAAEGSRRLFTREELIAGVWGIDFDGSDRAVDICVQRLRKRLKEIRSDVVIRTLWGQGYRLETGRDDAKTS